MYDLREMLPSVRASVRVLTRVPCHAVPYLIVLITSAGPGSRPRRAHTSTLPSTWPVARSPEDVPIQHAAVAGPAAASAGTTSPSSSAGLMHEVSWAALARHGRRGSVTNLHSCIPRNEPTQHLAWRCRALTTSGSFLGMR